MTDLAVRSRTEEQMDSPDLDRATYEQILADLARVNRWTLAARPTLAFLSACAPKRGFLKVLDVGFGRGDMLRRIALWARNSGRDVALIGIDLNAKSMAAARAETAGLPIELRIGDYRDLAGPFDCIISSLVAHHMSDDELIDFIRYMEGHATRGWLINDLHRKQAAYRGYPLLARLLRVHRVVREDGTLSVARSFRPREWRAILAKAGVPAGAARVVRRFPLRLCVERRR